MIRQSVSCDICGAEKKQTNHWFVTYTHAGELRVSLWSAQAKLRAGSKHLCGQTCLHKLVDEFIAGSMTVRMQQPVSGIVIDEPPVAADAAPTSIASNASATSCVADLPAPALPARTNVVAVIAIAPSRAVDEPRPPVAALPPADDQPIYTSHHWRTEAWERERERERRAGIAPRRKSS
jgi:hypothetical protein